ncbi:hypothetical protein GCM10027408_14550 [Microbacterium tumbae]
MRDLSLADLVMQLRGRGAHGDDEDEVEEQLEGARSAMRLMGIARKHPAEAETG